MKAQLKKEIETLAKETNSTFLQAATAMQGAAAQMGNESVISIIHELKIESDEFKAIKAFEPW